MTLCNVRLHILRSILVTDRRAYAIGWWLVGWIVDQGRQVFRGQQMAPQEGLHSVFGRHGLMDDFPVPDCRTAHDGEVDRLFHLRQGWFSPPAPPPLVWPPAWRRTIRAPPAGL